ncbi:stage II sporulation protein M [Methanocella arvoryzae]|nr:stage II sporulation protein M [Methanocella arvoryzae]
MRLLEDVKTIFRKDWKLFLIINAIYFGAILLGALIALAYPDLQISLIAATSQTYGSAGPLSIVGDAYLSGNIIIAAAITFVVNFFFGTVGMIIIPSLILPFWALLFCAYRALLWGIMLVVPVPGIMPLSVLAPHYLTLLLEGEAYVVAMFACTRGLIALLKPQSFGTDSRLQAYKKAIIDIGKLLIVVALLLGVAAVYEAAEVILVAGTAGGATQGGQFGFYDEEFGANSSYSNWTQTIPGNSSAWTSFGLSTGKLTRMHFESYGTPIDVMIMDKNNFTAYNSGTAGWSAYVTKEDAVNETFDFIPPHDDVYWIVMNNDGPEDVKIRMQLRYKL